MPGKRADTLLQTMRFIEWFTLRRAWDGLSDDELFWEPITGSWGVRRRGDCQTATPFGDGGWVVDFDADLVRAADEGNATEPLTTIGWLMWHVGSMPGRLAELDFLGGSRAADTGWTSPYLTAHRVFTSDLPRGTPTAMSPARLPWATSPVQLPMARQSSPRL